MKIFKLLFLLGCLDIAACSPLDEVESGDEEPGVLLYTNQNCGISGDIYWMDNETILFDFSCEGSMKKMNVNSKSVQRIQLPDFIYELIYTPLLANTIFYIAENRDASGSTTLGYSLYGRDLTTQEVRVVHDDLPETFLNYELITGTKKLGIGGENEILLIDLETAALQVLPVGGNIKAFSPDDSQLLIYPVSRFDASGAYIYDLSCQCSQPSPFSSAEHILWKPEGVFGFTTIPAGSLSEDPSLLLINASTNEVLTTVENLQGGPWSSPTSRLVFIWVSTDQSSSDRGGRLLSFDLVSRQTKEVAKGDCCLSAYNTDITEVSLSPDQKKLAFLKGGVVRMLSL